jgi:hypothetical protein
LDVGIYILRISKVESASDDDSSDFGRIFLGGEGVDNVWVLIGVDVKENGLERTAYSLLQIDFRYAGVNDDDDDRGERYYTRKKKSIRLKK